MLVVTGVRTTIVQEYLRLAVGETVARVEAVPSMAHPAPILKVPIGDTYLLAAGVLHQKPTHAQTEKEVIESLSVNFINVVRICEEVFSSNDYARICVVGSESGFRGSYDYTYAGAKAALHLYVMTRQILPTQQLVCVSPTIISNSGMTERRKDYPEVLQRRVTITAQRVASEIYSLLHDDIRVALRNNIVRITA